MTRRHDAALWLLLTTTAVLMPVALYWIFLVAPEEAAMGAVQRLFYFHVPLAALTFLSVFTLLAGAIGYLWTRRAGWDHLSVASAEVGFLCCTLVLTTGPVWAKSYWGVPWTWEAKLTTTLILGLLLAGILLARAYAATPEQGARIASVLGVIAALDVPVIYKAVDWWRGLHPIIFGPGKREPLDPRMLPAFLIALVVFTLLFALFLAVRMRLCTLEDRLAAAEETTRRSR